MLARAEEAYRRRRYRAASDEARRVLDALPADDPARTAIEPRVDDLLDVSRLFADLLSGIPKMSERSWAVASELSGTIEGATEERLDVRVGGARSGVAWADIPAERMLDLFRRGGADEAYALAVFCFDNGLEVEGSRELHNLVERAPEQAPRAYGLVARVREVAVPDDGFVFHEDRWLTREEQNLAALKTTIRSLAERIREGSGEEAASAAREIEDVLARPEPSPGFAQEARTLRASSIEARHEALIERLGRLPAMAAIERMKSLKREMNAARAEAMRVIFDKNLYPDEDHGRRGQPAVDKRVRQVRELWERPATTLPGSPKPCRDMLVSLLELEGLMGQYGGTGRRDGDWMRILSMLERPVSVRTVTLDDREQEVLDHNRRVQESNAAQKSAMTPDERRVVELVNEYREMMGLRILESDDLLATAARGHSEDMEARGFFAHENPDGKGPRDRFLEAGYPRAAVGENIVMGAYHAKEAHESWYGSSGHHRNMLDGDWTQMGCGRSGGHWTEDFGAAPPKPK